MEKHFLNLLLYLYFGNLNSGKIMLFTFRDKLSVDMAVSCVLAPCSLMENYLRLENLKPELSVG
jgi:hypothetical protein